MTHFNVNVTSRPLSPFTLTVKYRLFDYNDSTKELTFPGDVVNDRTLTLGALIVPRYNFTRQNADADARWRFGEPLAVTAGGGWESWHRNRNRELKNSDEYFGKVALDSTWLDWVQTRLTYRPSFRRIGHYNTDSPAQAGSPDSLTLSSISLGQSLLLRKFDEADRDIQRLDLLLQVFPVDTLTASITGGWKFDDYLHSPLGLQNGTTWSAGADVGWTPVERVSFAAGYVHELIYQKQRSRSRPVVGTTTLDFPDFDWIANNTDTIDTVNAGATVGLIPQKLNWVTNMSYSFALGRQETRNPNAPVVGSVARTLAAGGTVATNTANVATARAKPMPAFDDAVARLETALQYHLSKNWTASFGYVFESFQKHDWRTDSSVACPSSKLHPAPSD